MTTLVLDTNIVLRFLLDDVPEQQSAAASLLDRARRGEIVLAFPSVIVAECLYVLASVYQLGRREIADVLGGMVMAPGVEVDHRDVVLAALARYAASKFDFADCYAVALAASRDDTGVVTFDRDLQCKTSDVRVLSPLQWDDE